MFDYTAHDSNNQPLHNFNELGVNRFLIIAQATLKTKVLPIWNLDFLSLFFLS